MSVIEQIKQSNLGRNPQLVEYKYERMSEGLFLFFGLPLPSFFTTFPSIFPPPTQLTFGAVETCIYRILALTKPKTA